MKKLIFLVIFAIIVVNLVGLTVFLQGSTKTQTQTATPDRGTGTSAPSESTNPNASNSTNQEGITRTELSNHDSRDDCWVAYQGKVYDITSFLPRHPGSASAITPYCGTAEEFESAFKDQHGTSQVSRLIAESTFKGDLQ